MAHPSLDSFSLYRKDKPEARALARFAIHADDSVQLFYDAFANRKPQSCTMYECVQLHKSLEYVCSLFGFNADAGIGNVESHLLLLHLESHMNASL